MNCADQAAAAVVVCHQQTPVPSPVTEHVKSGIGHDGPHHNLDFFILLQIQGKEVDVPWEIDVAAVGLSHHESFALVGVIEGHKRAVRCQGNFVRDLQQDQEMGAASPEYVLRVRLRAMVKRILRRYGYPPDKQGKAAQTALRFRSGLARFAGLVYYGQPQAGRRRTTQFSLISYAAGPLPRYSYSYPRSRSSPRRRGRNLSAWTGQS